MKSIRRTTADIFDRYDIFEGYLNTLPSILQLFCRDHWTEITQTCVVVSLSIL